MRRREFMQQVGALGLAGLGAGPACRKPPTRERVLLDIVRDVLVQDARAILKESIRLDEAVSRFSAAPSEKTLLGARAAWKGAVVQWKRGGCFRKGPLIETGALFRTGFWPARAPAIDEVILSSTPIDDAYIEELGVDLKGLYALEYILFGADKAGASVPPAFAGEHAGRVLLFTTVLARNVRKWAETAAKRLKDGDPFAAELAGGRQTSIADLVNQMAGTAETVARKFRDVLDLATNGHLKPREIEGWPSGVSADILAALVQGTERLYAGGGGLGLADLVAPAAPAVGPRVRAAFADTLAAIRGIGSPIEVAAVANRPAVEQAARIAKTLEIALKVDLASALGVTLTFTSGDGD